MYFVPQILNDDCGFAALKMLLAKVHKDRNYLFLPQDENHGPYSLLELKTIAEKYGVTLNGYEAKREDFKHHKKFPFIAIVTTKVGGAHAVVVEKISLGSVYYLDPSEGRKEVTIKGFLNIWDGEMMQVDNLTYVPCLYKENKPIPKSGQVITTLMQLCACACIALGVYFIDVNVYMFIPIILFALAMVFEIFIKSYSISLLKKADIYFFSQVEVKDNRYLETLKRYEKYKAGLLATPLQFIMSLCIAFGLMLITLYNDMKNILLILVPFIASILENALVRPYIADGAKLLSKDEQELDNSVDEDDYKVRVYNLHTKAYKLGMVEMSKQYVGIALFIITAILTMRIVGVVSFPYIIFYSCIEAAIYRALSMALEYPEKNRDMLKAKVAINNCLHQNDENK